jgi:hypothetical protein
MHKFSLYVATLLVFTASVKAQRIDSLITPMSCAIVDIEFADHDNGVIIGQDSIQAPLFMMLTKDAGKIWDTIRGPFKFPYDLAFPRKDRLFVAAGGLFLSEDQGKTWTKVLEEVVNAVSIPDLAHVFTRRSRSVDSGRSWTPISVPLGLGNDHSYFYFQDSLHGIDARTGFDPNDPGLARFNLVSITYDGGITWHTLFERSHDFSYPHSGLFISDSTWLLTFLVRGIDYTSNGGGTWKGLPVGEGKEIVQDSRGIIYSSWGMRSLNKGLDFQDWANLSGSLRGRNIIRLVSDSILFVAATRDRWTTSPTVRIYVIYLNQAAAAVGDINANSGSNPNLAYDPVRKLIMRHSSLSEGTYNLFDRLGRKVQTLWFVSGVQELHLNLPLSSDLLFYRSGQDSGKISIVQ